MLSPAGFRFTIKRLPNVSFFTQQVAIPSVTLGTANVPTPFSNIPLPGDHLVYNELSVTFKVDEDLRNYTELYGWMVQLGFPESFDQYKAPQARSLENNLVSEGVLEILNSAKGGNREVVFMDMFPTSITEMSFDTMVSDIAYIEVTATFAYRMFKVN